MTHTEEYARTIDPGAWGLKGTGARRRAARAKARADVANNEYYAGVGARTQDLAGQWEHIARVLCFDFMRMPQRAFDVIVQREREKFIKGERNDLAA